LYDTAHAELFPFFFFFSFSQPRIGHPNFKNGTAVQGPPHVWPSQNIAITNIVWYMAYKRGVGGAELSPCFFFLSQRRIGHPNFKNGTAEQVASFLASAPVGECIFRPSSKGADHLTATVKLSASGPLLHIDIAEVYL